MVSSIVLSKKQLTAVKVQVTPDVEKMAKRTRKFLHSSCLGVCPYDSNFDGDFQIFIVTTRQKIKTNILNMIIMPEGTTNEQKNGSRNCNPT